MKNLPKGFIVPLLIVIILLLIGGGLFAYYESQVPNKPSNSTENTVNTSTTTWSIPNDPAAGEKLAPGQKVSIKWDNNQYSHVIVMVVTGKADKWNDYTNNGSMGTYRGYVIYEGSNNGSIIWTTPNEYPDAGDYLIRLEFENGTVVYSNNFFTISQ